MHNQVLQWVKAYCPNINNQSQADTYQQYIKHLTANNQPIITMSLFGRILKSQGIKRTSMRYEGKTAMRYDTGGNSRLEYMTVTKRLRCSNCEGKGFIYVSVNE